LFIPLLFFYFITFFIFIISKINDDTYCIKEFEIKKDLSPPIFFYYELTNFYINHVDYVKSRNTRQLVNETQSDAKLKKSCKNATYVKDIFDDKSQNYISFTGKKLDGNQVANPCGYSAKSYFRDTFELVKYNDDDNKVKKDDSRSSDKNEINKRNLEEVKIEINSNDISSYYDKKEMFENSANLDSQWIDLKDGNYFKLNYFFILKI
jgi:hypothetical protein